MGDVVTSGSDADDGSATIWTLALSLAALAMAWVALLVCVALGVRHRVEAAADLAALAGAAAAQSGSDGCLAAARTAQANHAELRGCGLAADGSITVTVAVVAPPPLRRWDPGEVTARARAGS